MSETNEFRRLAKEAMRGSSEAMSQDEKRALEDLACIWAKAALMSDQAFALAPAPVRQASRD